MKDTRSLVDLVCMNPNKEEEAWAWFCIGAELQKIGRNYRSTKKFGEAVSSTPLSHLPASDRSDARWMFQNWKDVLNWLEVESGLPVEDPFLMLSVTSREIVDAFPEQLGSVTLPVLESADGCSGVQG